MTTVLYFGREPDAGDDVADGLRRAGPHLDVSRASPDTSTEPPSAACVVVDPGTVDAAAVVADLRTAGYGGPVVLFGSGSHATLASQADELGATTYVRRDVAGDGDPFVRLAEAIERVTTGTPKRRETHLALLHELARDLMCVEDDVDAATTVVETMGRVLSAEAAVVATTTDDDPPGDADEDGRHVSVLAATAGFATEMLSAPRVVSAVTNGTEERLPADVVETADTTETADAAVGATDEHLVIVPVGDRWSLIVDGSVDRSVGVEFDLVRALAATVEVAFDRAEREARLREERDRIVSLFENTSDAIVDVEYVDGEPIVRDVNTTFERVFGVAGTDLVGRNLNEIIVPEGVDAPTEYWKDALAGEPYEREVRRATADGVRDFLLRSVPFDREGTRRGYAIYTDITERKRIERTLGRFHEITRDLIRAETRTEIAEITVRAASDVLDYPVTTVRLYEPTSESLRLVAVSDTTRELVDDLPEDGPGTDLGWEAFRNGEPRVVDDLRERGVETGLGRAMYLPLGGRGLLTLGSPEAEAFDESDRRLASILAANVEVALARAARISVLRDREDELARQNDRLDAFASVVSHDLRNPLSVARGYLGLARDACEGESDPAPHFERVERAHDRMNHLITDLLTLARQGQAVGETEAVALGAAAERAWNAVDTEEATLEIVEDRTIQADAERLDALFENLFRNSVEHGSPDGDGDTAVTVRIGALDDGFFVEDDGPGIPATERDQVFDRGYSTSDSGTGFGLSIVQGIAEAHGWTIVVTESEAGGVRFEVSDADSTPRGRLD